jgi:hypothetical protein
MAVFERLSTKYLQIISISSRFLPRAGRRAPIYDRAASPKSGVRLA